MAIKNGMQQEEMLMSQKLLPIDIRTLFPFWQSRKVPSQVPRCNEHVLRQKVCCEKRNAVNTVKDHFVMCRYTRLLFRVSLPTKILDL